MDATPFLLPPDGACGIEDRHGHIIRLPPGPWRSASIAAIRETLEHAPKVFRHVVINGLPCSDKR
jgi:hypothetical protein